MLTWAVHAARRGEVINGNKFLSVKPEVKKPLRRSIGG